MEFYEGRAFESGGYFGIPQAAMNTIEEQGRGRLHVYIGIWIKKIQQTLQELFINDNIQGKKVRNKEKQKKSSLLELKKEINHISSTDVISSMMKYIQQNQLQTILTHTCKGDMRKSKILRVDDQTLRCMRHKEGSHLFGGEIAYCSQCNKKWNSNEINLCLIQNYLKNQVLQHSVDYEDYFGNLYETSIDVFDNKPSNYTMNKINAILLRNRSNLLQKNPEIFSLIYNPLSTIQKTFMQHYIINHALSMVVNAETVYQHYHQKIQDLILKKVTWIGQNGMEEF